jgi:hypothetical protein
MSPTEQEVYTYTSRHLMRTYPMGLRINSSNYNPFRAWSLGEDKVEHRSAVVHIKGSASNDPAR